MNNISTRANTIISLLNSDTTLSSTEISQKLNFDVRTIQRELLTLEKLNYVNRVGKGKATSWQLNLAGKLNYIPSTKDFKDTRLSQLQPISYNFKLLSALKTIQIFDTQETQNLQKLATTFNSKINLASQTLKKREFERLIIEFSWKSSQIEGNTYSLLETEELLKQTTVNFKHSRLETQMILNHKLAFDYILSNKKNFLKLSSKTILNVHSILTEKLEIDPGYRKSGVGITGSLYRPLDNQFQIQEAVTEMCEVLNQLEPFSKALLTGLLLSYIQPFNDGNKRTARMITNSVLYSCNLPMLSFRSISVEQYRDAIIGFYELNSLYLYKKLFVSQLEYFTENYF